MEEIRVISGDKDGADLRREKLKNPYHSRASGKADDDVINEAISYAARGRIWGFPDGSWDRIFRSKK